MRWNELFDDLEGQLEHELAVDEAGLRVEEERLRLGRLALRDRLLAPAEECPDRWLRLELRDGGVERARATGFGRDWVAVELDARVRRTGIVPLAAIVALGIEPDQVEPSVRSLGGEEPGGSLAARLGLAFVVRDLCRRRSTVEVRTSVRVLTGTIDRVGRDHFDLALHALDEPRRRGAVSGFAIVAFDQLSLVRL